MNIEEELIKEEGLRLSCYKDSLGNYTIGVGHLLKSPCDDVSLEYAGRLLNEDIHIAQNELREKLPVYAELNQVRKYVLISMCFNMGIKRLLTFKKMIKALEQRNYEVAAAKMKDSAWYRQVKSRADKLINLMKKGA